MEVISINYLAVLVAALVNMGIGALWYSPLLFGKMWMRMTGISAENMGKMGRSVWQAYASSFVGALVMAYVLAHIIDFAEATTAIAGIAGGFWCWLGFVATTSLATVFFERRSWDLYLLNNAYNLVALMAMGALLATW